MAMSEQLPDSNIWDAALDMDWNRVVDECSQCPLNARYVDGDYDETPLHLAIQNDAPIEAIIAIVHAFPKALTMSSRSNKYLPLHVACKYRSSLDILKVLTRDSSTALFETKLGKKPIQILWEGADSNTKATEEFWSKVMVVLSAVARSRYDTSVEVSDEEFLLHAAVSLGARSCPIEVVRYLLDRNPYLASQRDWSHRLPLHIAVGPSSWSNVTRRKYRPRERVFISFLLEAHPVGARTKDKESNRYPLHVALSNRHCWSEGVLDLIHAAPEVLLKPDPVTKLYPFQLAAVPVGNTSVDLDTVFCLLRSQPDVLGFFDLKEHHHGEESNSVFKRIRRAIYDLSQMEYFRST